MIGVGRSTPHIYFIFKTISYLKKWIKTKVSKCAPESDLEKPFNNHACIDNLARSVCLVLWRELFFYVADTNSTFQAILIVT